MANDLEILKKYENKVEKKKIQYVYPMDLQFYTNRLDGTENYLNCVNSIFNRIKVLKMVYDTSKNAELSLEEQIEVLSTTIKYSRITTFGKLLKNNGHFSNSIEDMIHRQYDHASFLFLSLAVCDNKNNSVINWWLDTELKFFKLRSMSLDEIGVVNFITENDIPLFKIDENTIECLKEKLMMHGKNFQQHTFYKLPAKTVMDLILSLKVFHRDGDACVPAKLIIPILWQYYPKILKEHLKDAKSYKKLLLMYDLQMKNIFQRVQAVLASHIDINSDLYVHRPSKLPKSSDIGYNLNSTNIDKFAVSSFPPCMLRIHKTLRKHHHLKNPSRVQYVLFLRGLGMKFENVLSLLKEEFIKKISEERFDKEYTYYVKHMYGLVGSKKEYPSRDCKTIAESVVPIDDCNGCPFYQPDIEELVPMMKLSNISDYKIGNIVKFSKRGKTNVACAEFFGASHCCQVPEPIDHPNEYVCQSIKKHREGLNESIRVTSTMNESIMHDNHAVPKNLIDLAIKFRKKQDSSLQLLTSSLLLSSSSSLLRVETFNCCNPQKNNW